MNFRAKITFFNIRYFILSKNGAKLQRVKQSSKKKVTKAEFRDKKGVFGDKLTK